MIDEKIKERIGELREANLGVGEIANALKISESTVKRYSSGNREKDIKGGGSIKQNKFFKRELDDKTFWK